VPERIRNLRQLTATMLRSLDLAALGPEIVRAAMTLEAADAAALMLVDEASDALRIVAHEGLSDGPCLDPADPDGAGAGDVPPNRRASRH